MMPSLVHFFFFFYMHQESPKTSPEKQEPSLVSQKKEERETGRATSGRRSPFCTLWCCTHLVAPCVRICLSFALSHQGQLRAPLVVACTTGVQQKPDWLAEAVPWAYPNSLQEWMHQQEPETSHSDPEIPFCFLDAEGNECYMIFLTPKCTVWAQEEALKLGWRGPWQELTKLHEKITQ